MIPRVAVLALLATLAGCGPRDPGQTVAPPASTPAAPSLIVLLAVDQLRADLLERYDALFTGGLRRLRDEGFRFENGTHDHALTATAPGHHTLSTGVHPTRHGIVGNSWLEQRNGDWQSVYSVEDPSRSILGYPTLEGRGPANTYRPGLPDWIVERDPASRVVSVSRKDRSAIGLAAQARGEVYWLLQEGGVFVTSDYYHSEYPDWVRSFNEATLPSIYSDTVWESVTPPEGLPLTRPDTSRFERGRGESAFPHRAADAVDPSDPAALNGWRYTYTPFPDRVVVAFAVEAVRELELGLRGSVDYLGISLSQTDAVGHRFGPRSREQLDNLLRLDAELGRLLDSLDELVGTGRWVLALSADHGVLDIPEHLAEEGVDAERLGGEERDLFRESITETARAHGPGDGLADAVKSTLEGLPFVEAAYTFDEIERGEPADSFAVLFGNSHSRTRVSGQQGTYGVYIRRRPHVLSWGSNAATHGSPYHYDRHVPIAFLGAGVRAGVSPAPAATIDVAPTLAGLAGVPAPDDLDGRFLGAVTGR